MPGQVPERSIPDIALYYRFEHPPAELVLQEMERETVSILQPLADSIEWRSLEAARPGDAAGDLAVITFAGRCESNLPMPTRTGQRTLGRTHVSDGVVLPFSDIDCDRIRGYLHRELARVPEAQRQRLLGRALGRVVAHEMYHVFAKTMHHRAAGVARSSFTVKELTGKSFRIRELDEAVNLARAPDGAALFASGGCVTCHGYRGEGSENGPPLRPHGKMNVLSLGAKLADHASTMYRHTRDLDAPVRSFGESEIRSLLKFLNNGFSNGEK